MDKLDCGHAPTPRGIGTGKETDPKTGFTRCYPCAEEHERESIKTADVYSVYLTSDRPNVVTSWTGAVLGTVTSWTRGKKMYAKDGPYRMQSVSVRTPDGAEWYGRGRSDVDAITIRRSKAK